MIQASQTPSYTLLIGVAGHTWHQYLVARDEQVPLGTAKVQVSPQFTKVAKSEKVLVWGFGHWAEILCVLFLNRMRAFPLLDSKLKLGHHLS